MGRYAALSFEFRIPQLLVISLLAVIGFAVGVIATAAYDSRDPFTTAPVSAAGAEGAQIVEVELGDLFIKPVQLQAEAGSVRFQVTNSGQTEHNFAIEGVGGTEMIAPGDVATLEVPSIEPGTYNFICEVPGHADGGMKGTLVVGKSSGDPGTDNAGHGMSAEEMALLDAEVTASFPAETKGVGGVELEPDIASGVKVFELTADEIKWEVSPGEFKEAGRTTGWSQAHR